jgi:hypothetical protein
VVIAKNKAQFPKNVFSDNEVGEKIKIFRSLSDADEAILWQIIFGNSIILIKENLQILRFYIEPIHKPELSKMLET